MKLSEAFRDAGFWFRVGDYQFRFTCSCGTKQELDACTQSERGDVTVYVCKHCGADVAGVALDDRVFKGAMALVGPRDDDDGHRMCGHVFGANVDMELWPSAATEPFLQIPRRPAFFTSRGASGAAGQAS